MPAARAGSSQDSCGEARSVSVSALLQGCELVEVVQEGAVCVHG